MNRKSLLHLLAYSLLTFLFATSSAEAQPTREADSQGYLFVAPGGVRNGDGTLHLGGGGEGVFKSLSLPKSLHEISPRTRAAA